MKRFAAIFLTTLFVFNFVGYRWVFNYVQKQSDLRLEASLDKDDFNEAELLKIEVPLSVPYQNNQQNFERVDGELKVNGQLYKYVKRKITDGKLVLLCLPNHEKMKLQSAKDEFFKYANDLVQNNGSKKSDQSKLNVFKNLSGEYDYYTVSYKSFSSIKVIDHTSITRVSHLASAPHCSPEQPPELA